jgi:hypothetical protein
MARRRERARQTAATPARGHCYSRCMVRCSDRRAGLGALAYVGLLSCAACALVSGVDKLEEVTCVDACEDASTAQSHDGGALDGSDGAPESAAPPEAGDGAPESAVPPEAGDGAPESAAPPGGGIALVQQAGSNFMVSGGTQNQASAMFTSPNTANSTIIALGFWQVSGVFSATITDTIGNTYSSIPAVDNPQGVAMQIFYLPHTQAGANTVTITMSAGFDSYVGLAIFEYAGLGGSSILEGSAGQYAPATTSAASTPPVMTSSSDSLLFAGFADTDGSGVITPGPAWTALVTNDGFYMLAEARIVSTTGTFAASATLPSTDNSWVAVMAAFQGAP